MNKSVIKYLIAKQLGDVWGNKPTTTNYIPPVKGRLQTYCYADTAPLFMLVADCQPGLSWEKTTYV